MPELPEVETIVRALKPEVTGKTILDLDLLHPRIYRNSNSEKLKSSLVGKQINLVSRRGKYLLFTLENPEPTFAIHLGMSGQLIVSQNNLENKHIRAKIHLNQGNYLNFIDIRTFGQIFLIDGKEPTGFRKLGMEPLDDELTAEKMESLYSKHHVVIKTLMLNQQIIVGIGNIYASEALFHSGINPYRMADDLTSEEYKLLYKNLRLVLRDAIDQMGTTFSDYRRPDGSSGKFSNKLLVYGRNGQPCTKCETKIERINQNGRSTFYCPRCQK